MPFWPIRLFLPPNLPSATPTFNISREWNWCEEQVKYLNRFVEKDPQDFILSNGKPYAAKKMLNYAFKYFHL